jgi:transposase-like protein
MGPKHIHKDHSMPEDKYTYCPSCHKKGVYFKPRGRGEDNYRCKYCKFYFFASGESEVDIVNKVRFMVANKMKEMP